MKIAILNESFLEKSHIETLQSLGEVTIYENTQTEEEVIERLVRIDIAIADCFVARLTRKVFENCPDLRLLIVNTTLYDLVDTIAAKENSIMIANVPEYATEAVAEHTFALLLSALRKIPLGDSAMRKSPFQIDPGSSSERVYLGNNLSGKTIGIIGLGAIGQHVARIAAGVGMKVLAHTRTPKHIDGVVEVPLETLLAESDIVTLHTPLTAETEYLINTARIAEMKPGSVLINTARGKLVDEKALHNALVSGTLRAAGLDVLNDWSTSNTLLSLPQVVFTPHSAFYTQEALQNCADTIVATATAYAAGTAINIVNR
jgi:lactate dehydrogenase-like 2-hydroxyacid dehydrogenase